MKALFLGTGVASLLAIADLPYGYYEFLRWLVTIAAIVPPCSLEAAFRAVHSPP